jgi:hypothetical protein
MVKKETEDKEDAAAEHISTITTADWGHILQQGQELDFAACLLAAICILSAPRGASGAKLHQSGCLYVWGLLGC